MQYFCMVQEMYTMYNENQFWTITLLSEMMTYWLLIKSETLKSGSGYNLPQGHCKLSVIYVGEYFAK